MREKTHHQFSSTTCYFYQVFDQSILSDFHARINMISHKLSFLGGNSETEFIDLAENISIKGVRPCEITGLQKRWCQWLT